MENIFRLSKTYKSHSNPQIILSEINLKFPSLRNFRRFNDKEFQLDRTQSFNSLRDRDHKIGSVEHR